MKSAQEVRLGVRVIIGLNLIVAWGSIWVFTRMAPAIERIISRNEQSLHSCEEMLVEIASCCCDSQNLISRDSFASALQRARDNITESSEPDAIDSIELNYTAAFNGDTTARKKTVDAIVLLGEINRDAMGKADAAAQRLGNAGAWGVVFMATAMFLAGILLLQSLKRNLVVPLEEISSVFTALRQGDTMRRCSAVNPPSDIAALFRDINLFIDSTADATGRSSSRNPS